MVKWLLISWKFIWVSCVLAQIKLSAYPPYMLFVYHILKTARDHLLRLIVLLMKDGVPTFRNFAVKVYTVHKIFFTAGSILSNLNDEVYQSCE